jgi:hypothetical protein
MSYEISLSGNGTYVHVRVTEPMTRDLARRIALEANAHSSVHAVKRFLYDMRGAPNVETVFSNYQYANEDMASLQLERSARCAILVRPDDHSHDFVETAIRNAGYQVRLFTVEAEAIAWLAEPGTP